MLFVLHKQFKVLPSEADWEITFHVKAEVTNSHGTSLAELSVTETNDAYSIETGV